MIGSRLVTLADRFPLWLLLGGALLVYLPTIWAGGFIWDDDRFITRNPLILAPDGLWRFWFTTQAPDFFPLTSTTLWFEWRLWGMAPRGYHLTNVLLHGCSAVLLWHIARQLGLNSQAALLGAALFLAHPLCVMSVSWITERKNTLSLCLALLSLWLALGKSGSSSWRSLMPALLAFLAALLAKTSVVTLPVVLLGIWWAQGKKLDKSMALQLAPFFAASAVLSVVTIWFQYTVNIGSDVVRTDGFLSRLLIAGQAVWFYVAKAFFPFGLVFVYPRWSVDGLQIAQGIPGLMALILGMAFWWKRKAWGPWPLVVWISYLALLFPILGFFDVYFMRYTLVSDHWQYVALPVICLGSAAALARWLPARMPLAWGLILLFLPMSWWHQGAYRNEETLWRTTLVRNPNAFLASNNLGRILEQQGKIREAMSLYEQAIQSAPDYREARHNLGTLLAATGEPSRAEEHFRRALHVDPGYIPTLTNYGNLLKLQGRGKEALDLLQKAVELKSSDLELRNNLAAAFLDSGNKAAAEAELRRILSVNPAHPGANGNLGILLAERGELNAAIPLLRRCAEGQPNRPEAWQNLAQALRMAGDGAGAQIALRHAAELSRRPSSR